MEKLKLLKSVAFPAALALSAAIHVVAFQAFDVKTAGNAPHREVYEVRIAYMKSDLEAFEAETRAPLPVEASPADTQVLLPAEVRPRKRRSEEPIPTELREAETPAAIVHEKNIDPPLELVADAPSAAKETAFPQSAPPATKVVEETTLAMVDKLAPSLPAEDVVEFAPETVSFAEYIARINAEVNSRIDAKKVYPPAARKRGIEGTVECRLSVDPSGSLSGVTVVRSSGSRLLDKAALDLLVRVFPIENPTGSSLTLEKAIRYSLIE